MPRALIPNELLAGEFLLKRYGATPRDYERAADEDSRIELLDGTLIMHSPASVRHERLFRFLLSILDGYARARTLGEVFGARTPMFLDDDRRFEPDLMLLATGSLSRLGEVELTGPADLVIEILSPATRDYDLGEKRAAYAEGGVPEYWVVDSVSSQVLVDRPAGTRIAELSSGRLETPALPGFWLEVEWLWRDPLPDPAECLRRILGE